MQKEKKQQEKIMKYFKSTGVPLYQSFSSMIFTSLRISTQLAAYLSILYPILQLLLLFRMRNTTLTRRQLVIGGYTFALVIFILLLTSIYFSMILFYINSNNNNKKKTFYYLAEVKISSNIFVNFSAFLFQNNFPSSNKIS